MLCGKGRVRTQDLGYQSRALWSLRHTPGLNTYYVRDRLGEIRPFVVKAYVVPGLKYDLLSVKGRNQAGYRVIRDEDEEESAVFAVINKKIDKAKSFPFMSEHSNLFSLKLEQMSATQFEKQSGYELWHRANCDAAKETSYLTQFATNCIFATNDRYIFCSFGSGGFWCIVLC